MDKVKQAIRKFKMGKVFSHVSISREECDMAISALRKEIPVKTIVVEDSDEDESGKPFIMKINFCPVCNKGYRFLVPSYCEKCGQKLLH